MRKLYELCYGIEPEEKDLQLLEIKYQRLLDNGYSDKEATKILIDTKLNINEYKHEDSIIDSIDSIDPLYRHHELQIHSKPGGFDPATCTIIKRPYYLEMRQRYTMNDLLNYYYTKLIVPPLFRDEKRDIGAFNHLINSFKSPVINSVDFILFVIDYAASNGYKTNNPLDLKNWFQSTYEYLEQFVLSAKIELVNREDVLI
jgi:hypothetical protein